jgi:hypothetical protein
MVVKVEPDTAIPEATLGALALIGEAVVAHATERKFKVRTAVFIKGSLEQVWAAEVPKTPGLLTAIAKSKARSFFDGKKMADPSTPEVLCCYMCPWLCGCTKQMAVQGAVGFTIPGMPATEACFVVTGSPAGSQDLANAVESLTKHGYTAGANGVYAQGGAPPVADAISR